MTRPRRIQPWALVPFIVIGVAIIPNVVLVLMSRQARPQPADAQPYLAAQRFDADAQAASTFAAAGGRLAVRTDGRRLIATADLGTAMPRDCRLRLYCPADAAADRLIPWSDPRQPLIVDLPRGGRWVARLDGDGHLGLATAAVDAP